MKSRIVAIAAVAFIAFHVLILGGAGAYVAHIAGFDIPFLDHRHKIAMSHVEAVVMARLQKEEDFSQKPYTDTRGVLTIGYGTAIGEGITKTEAAYLLRERLTATHDALLKGWPPFRTLPGHVQEALLDMGYQLGVHGVLSFHVMLIALEHHNYQAARKAALASEWAEETPKRAARVADRLLN